MYVGGASDEAGDRDSFSIHSISSLVVELDEIQFFFWRDGSKPISISSDDEGYARYESVSPIGSYEGSYCSLYLYGSLQQYKLNLLLV